MTLTPSFTFVIPVRNEADDIGRTLEAALKQVYEGALEIIVIDDASHDATPDVVEQLGEGDGRVKLIRNTNNVGAATSRNRGIAAASGDIVIMVDADVLVPPDFLTRLACHYRDGADCVSVESQVVNRANVYGRFQQATHEVKFGGLRNVGYSQAFSCRRELAVTARFPEELPGCGGEDGEFFHRIVRYGCRWVRDPTIVVGHWMPDTLGSVWRQWRGRGRAVPYVEQRLRGKSYAAVVARRLLAFGKTAVILLALLPGFAEAVRRARRSERHWKDAFAFFGLYNLFYLAHRVGEAESLRQIYIERRHP
jgi:glycosyltransferase involved in cell wall biosynthesis